MSSEERETHAPETVDAYTRSILDALGSRDPFEVLRETPGVLPEAIAGLSPEQLSTRERPGKWSVRHVLQHLADAELVGAFRYRMVLAYDGPSLPAYDQDLWAESLRYEDSDSDQAVALFTLLRRANLRLLQRATPADLRRVMRHEERGDESIERTISLYAGHDIVHRRQIARIRSAIGAA